MKPYTIRRHLPGLLLLLGSLLPATSATAQTTVLEVKDSGSTTLAQVNDDGGLLVKGAWGTGTIPSTGAGTRMMWYPRKAAFRAGDVLGSQWDAANVGDYSVAMGINTTASGFGSVAMGTTTTASGDRSTAMGGDTEASGDYATAMGTTTTASGFGSVAMGTTTTASGDRSTAMGSGTLASGFTSTAMGFDTEAIAFRTTAMGNATKASGSSATAMGDNTTASSTASTAMGYFTTASSTASTAMGFNTTAQAYASLVLGRYNDIAGNTFSWVATDPVLVVGNGSSTGSTSDAFTLLKNGNLTIAGTLTQSSDRRLKTDIHPLTDALAGLARLQPVRYRFREGTNRPEGAHIGLIAQEVQAVFPELVSAGADGYLSVSYANLSAVLVQALHEQQAEIDALQDLLARLEATLRQRVGPVPATAEAR